MAKLVSVLLAAALLMTSCSQAGSNHSTMSYSERKSAASKLNQRLAEQNNRLGLKLFNRLWESGEGNVTISPYSIYTALALAYNGSKGETAAELGELLGYNPDELKQLNTDQKKLLRLIEQPGTGIQLEVANSVWGKKELPLRKAYIKTSENYYGAEIRTTDFTSAQSVTDINTWISEHTGQTIKNMLNEPPGAQAIAVLVNALYFKGKWKDVFMENWTYLDDFHPTADTVVKVPLMNQGGLFQYAENKEWQVIRLPYGEGQADMVVILPVETSSLEKVMTQMAENGLPGKDLFEERLGTVSLPRFKANYGADLVQDLQALGVKLAFDAGKGDFSALAETAGPISISRILHKTYLDVNEWGTEAAATTVIAMVGGGAVPTEIPFEMKVNRPFLFVIEDTQTGVWLFLGAIENPMLAE